MRYDNGEDLDDPMGGMGDIDPSQIFQTFFGGGGGPGGGFGGFGGPGGFHQAGGPGRGGHNFTFSFG